MERKTIRIEFGLAAHGFKLSPQFNNRLYFYKDQRFDMDVKFIPEGKWIIKGTIEMNKTKVVILEEVDK